MCYKTLAMAIQVKREQFDPEAGKYQYHLQFRPVEDDTQVRANVSVEVAFSISENGELAELSFILPKVVRNHQAMKYLNQEESVNAVDSRVFIVVPPANGDSVLRAPGDLELDAAGCIVGVKIH
jgi:hypothetical protein